MLKWRGGTRRRVDLDRNSADRKVRQAALPYSSYSQPIFTSVPRHNQTLRQPVGRPWVNAPDPSIPMQSPSADPIVGTVISSDEQSARPSASRLTGHPADRDLVTMNRAIVQRSDRWTVGTGDILFGDGTSGRASYKRRSAAEDDHSTLMRKRVCASKESLDLLMLDARGDEFGDAGGSRSSMGEPSNRRSAYEPSCLSTSRDKPTGLSTRSDPNVQRFNVQRSGTCDGDAQSSRATMCTVVNRSVPVDSPPSAVAGSLAVVPESRSPAGTAQNIWRREDSPYSESLEQAWFSCSESMVYSRSEIRSQSGSRTRNVRHSAAGPSAGVDQSRDLPPPGHRSTDERIPPPLQPFQRPALESGSSDCILAAIRHRIF